VHYLQSQNVKNYFTVNSFVLNQEASENNLTLNNLLSYKYYFFGESHTAQNVEKQEMALAEILIKKKDIKLIFSEMSVFLTSKYQSLLKMSPKDTSAHLFDEITSGNLLEQYALRKVYSWNINTIEDKIEYIPIDVVEYPDINIKDFQKFFRNKNFPHQIKDNLKKIKRIRRRIFNNEKDGKDYYSFCVDFMKDSVIYKNYFSATDYNYLRNVINGMFVFFDMEKLGEHLSYTGSYKRDSFMCSNIITNTINGYKSFISINGQFHIPLTIQNEWFGMNDWQSLAYQFNQKHGNVCSICFINRDNDYLMDYYYPNEKKVIFENTKPGETYLIRLDGEGTPFKELSEKFQYIVIW
jgi:hypothetical protein